MTQLTSPTLLPEPLDTLVRNVCRQTRGAFPTTTERLHSVCNDVFRLGFSEGDPLILKIYSRGHGADRQRRGDRIESERQAMALLAARDVPVAPVEAADLSADTPWLLMRDVGAASAGNTEGLSPEESKRVYRRCGELFAAVHQVTLGEDAPGLWRHGKSGGAEHIADPVLRWAIGRAESHALVSPELLRRFRAAATALPARPVLCHGDFHPDQCVRGGAHVTAIVDWESATFGDATPDHAKFANYLDIYFEPDLSAEALAGYASHATPPADDHPNYRALRALHAVALSPAERSGDRFALAWWDLAVKLTQTLRGN